MNAAGIETMAGLRSGKIACALWKRSTQTVGLSTMSSTDRTEPVTIEQTAPAVVKRLHTIESSSGGKFALQAIANARPTMKATFWPLKTMPSSTASDAEHDCRRARDAHLFVVGRVAAADHVDEDVVRERARAGQRQAGDDRKDRRKRDRGDEAEERRAAEELGRQRRRHVAAGSTFAMISRPTSAEAPKPTIGMMR